MKQFRSMALLLGCLLYIPLYVASCTTAAPLDAYSGSASIDRRFEQLKASPPQLTAFLRAMPKGADLHSHLSGAVYAESYIAWATDKHLCLVVATQTIVAPPCSATDGKPTVAEATKSAAQYDALIDALSVRNYQTHGVSGHDQFFATFARFDAAGDGRDGAMQAEVMARAASQNILYLELMNSAGMGKARKLGALVGYDGDFDKMAEKLRQAGIDNVVDEARKEFATINKDARARLGCNGAPKPPACDVEVRYLAQIIRVFPKEQVFAQTMLAFLLAQQDASVVGLNIVAPEDDRVSLDDYSVHMAMIGTFAKLYPDVRISLHAGELTLGLVRPKHLRFHIAEAVEVAHAARIGHGVDIMFEDQPLHLLREMAAKQVMVEINLTSNDVILGVAGADHPFETYRAFGVPMALSTDDEGVSRIDLTHEYVRAVLTYDLSYREVKALSFNGLTYAFVDDATKSRLLTDLKQAFADFEMSYGAPMN